MTKSKYIFEQLAREGECWHVSKINPGWKYDPYCIKCGSMVFDINGDYLPGIAAPDFSTAAGREWVIERLMEQDACIVPSFSYQVHLSILSMRADHTVLVKTYATHNEYCLGFEDAIHEFLKGRESSVNGRP